MKRKTYIGLKAWDMGFDAHLTLIYTGKVNPAMEQRIQEIIYKRGRQIHLAERTHIKMFGEFKNIPAVTLNPSDHLWNLRQKLLREGIPDRSGFNWNPHISLDLSGQYEVRIPKHIKLTDLGFY